MREAFSVKLPKGRTPKFPPCCAVCGRDRPMSEFRLAERSFPGWLPWNRKVSFKFPACPVCASRFKRSYRIRYAVDLVLIVAALLLSFWIVRGLPGIWRLPAGLGLAVVLLIPWFVWQVLYPKPVEIETSDSGCEFKFTNEEFHERFAAMNQSRPSDSSAQTGGADRVQALFEQGRLDAVISIEENRLRAIQPATPFHAILGRDFLHQVDAAADWLARFHDRCAENYRPAAIYVEMVRFDINFHQWSLCACGHMEVPEQPMNESEWDGEMSDDLVLTGMEDMQRAMKEFRDLECDSADAADEPDEDGPDGVESSPGGGVPEHLREAQGEAFFLIMLHMQNLVRRAAARCAERGHPVGLIPVFANVHDETMVFAARPNEELLAAAAATAKYIRVDEYSLTYPHRWRVDVDDAWHDMHDRITIISPGAALFRLEIYDQSALHSADEHAASIAKVLWEREKVNPPTDVEARARKLIQENEITRAKSQPLEQWSNYRGQGVRVTGRLGSGGATIVVFAHTDGPIGFVAIEQFTDADFAKYGAGFEMIRSSLRFGRPDIAKRFASGAEDEQEQE